MNFKALSRVRYPLCEFSEQPLDPDKLNKILEAGRKSPTARNFQSQRVFVLCSSISRENLNPCLGIKNNAPVVVVVGYDEQVAWKRETDGKNHGEIDASICALHMMLQALDLGIGTSIVTDFDPVKLREVFPQMQNVVPVAVLPMGYPVNNGLQSINNAEKESDKKMVRFL